MWKRQPIRVAAACAALCAAGVLGASAASASPAMTARPVKPALSVTFSARKGPIPGVRTNASPELTQITFPGSTTVHTLLVYKGYNTNDSLYYTYANKAMTSWTKPAQIDAVADARSLHRPSAAFYTNATGHYVIVVWQGSGPAEGIWYSIGVATAAGKLVFGPETQIPGVATSNGPTVYTWSSKSSTALFLTWKAPTSDIIRYMILTPVGAGVSIGPLQTLPNGALTNESPTVADLGVPAETLLVFWRGAVSGKIWFEFTPDPTAASPGWNPETSLPSNRLNANSPQAEGVGPGQSLPLLVTYCGRTTGNVFYTLYYKGVAGPQGMVPSLKAGVEAPGLDASMIAATDPSTGQVYYSLLKTS
jgi:hypothetical protein